MEKAFLIKEKRQGSGGTPRGVRKNRKPFSRMEGGIPRVTPPALTTPPFCPILIHRLNLGLSHRRKTHGLYSGGDGAAAGVPASTIRYYDKEGLLPFVGRSSGGIRVFTEKDFEWLRYHRVPEKDRHVPLRNIREYIELAMQGDENH